ACPECPFGDLAVKPEIDTEIRAGLELLDPFHACMKAKLIGRHFLKALRVQCHDVRVGFEHRSILEFDSGHAVSFKAYRLCGSPDPDPAPTILDLLYALIAEELSEADLG